MKSALVHQLLGSEAYIHQSRINYKPEFLGNRSRTEALRAIDWGQSRVG